MLFASLSTFKKYSPSHHTAHHPAKMMPMLILSIITLLAASPSCMGFAPMHHSTTVVVSSLPTSSIRSTHVMHATPVDMLDLASSLNTNIIGSSSMSADANAIGNTMASSSMILSETEAWVQPLSLVLGPFLNFFSFAMVSVQDVCAVYYFTCLVGT